MHFLIYHDEHFIQICIFETDDNSISITTPSRDSWAEHSIGVGAPSSHLTDTDHVVLLTRS